MQNFRNLVVWQKAHQLTLDVYAITNSFPREEQFGVTSQMRRASSSIPTNLAEGTGKLTDRDFRRYVSISFGSSNELEYLLLLSSELHYLPFSDYTNLDAKVKEVKKMLSGLIDSLNKRIYTKIVGISILLIGALAFILV